MDGPMVATAEHGQVREDRRPSWRPVLDVMALSEAHAAARKATPVIAIVKCAAYGGWNRSRSHGHLHHAAVSRVLHHHARLASQAKRRGVSAETCSPLSSMDWPGASGSASAGASTWTTTWMHS